MFTNYLFYLPRTVLETVDPSGQIKIFVRVLAPTVKVFFIQKTEFLRSLSCRSWFSPHTVYARFTARS